MSGPRILMVIHRFRPTFTGHGLQIETMGRLLVRRGARVLIATSAVAGQPETETADGVEIRRFRFHASRNPLALHLGNRDFTGFMRRNGGAFDVLHLHGSPPVYPVAIPTARRLGWRTVITTTLLGADDPVTLRHLGRLAAWRFRSYRAADRFVAICPALADRFPPAGIPPARVEHIPVGVDVERFAPGDREGAARELGWDVAAPRALFVGLVLRRKGVDVLLDAWERVLREVPEARLYLAGGHTFPASDAGAAAFADAVRARAGTPPLAGRVVLLGPQTGLERHYRAAHVFVFPSRLEGFPNVVLEALASGTPPVVTRIPGSTDESVRDGETGFVVEQEDAALLAERVVRLFRDETLRRRLALAARADAERRYAFPIVAGRHLALYEALLRGGRGARSAGC